MAMAGSEYSPIRPDAHRAEPDVEVGKHDRAKAHPGPEHVAPIETTHTLISFLAKGGFGRLVKKSADQMAQGMAAERIAAKEHNIDRQHERAKPHSEPLGASGRIDKPQRLPDVVGEEQKQGSGEVKSISMRILQDQWKGAFAQIGLARFSHRA